MNIKWKYYLFLCLPWVFINTMQAQEVIASSGGYGTTSGAKVIWTIGEPVIETISSASIILTQGFNQGDLIITIIKDPELSGLDLKAYPNPASDRLLISIGDSNFDQLDYILFDLRGQIISKNKLKGVLSEIPLEKLFPSTYFLRIYRNNTEVAIFKIIKTK